jgi:amino acid transporter
MGKFSTEVQPSREMSVFDVTLVGVGAMIGAGIFVLIAMSLTEIGIAHDIVIIGFASIIITLCLAVLILLWLSGSEGAARILGSARRTRQGAEKSDSE